MSDAKRPIPQDVELEQALLGAIMSDGNAYWRVAETLKAEHFFEPFHQRMYTAIAKLCETDRAVTPLTLRAAMKNDPAIAELKDDYFQNLVYAAPAMPKLRDYGALIRELAVRRKLIAAAQAAIDAASGPIADAGGEAIAETLAEASFNAVHADRPGEGAVDIRTLTQRAAQMAEDARTLPRSVCLTSGLWTADKHLSGVYRRNVTYIGGAPNMGKTALLEHISLANAQNDPDTGEAPEETIFFSLEMLGEELAMRQLAQRTRISSDLIRRGAISGEDSERIFFSAQQYPDLLYRIDDTRRLSVAQMRARVQARKRRSNRGVKLVAIDNLRLIRPANPRATAVEQLDQTTSDLKDLATELDVAVLCLSHLNRDYTKRSNFRPQLSDLYGASSIEQNADAVWFVHREIYYLERNPPSEKDAEAYTKWLGRCGEEKGWAEVFSAKQRMGKIGTARVRFDEKFTQYEDPEPEPTQDEMALWEAAR